ncbi:MAG: hopanoid-associated sugar epimerase [Elusimicrobiota bacterium]
MDAAFLTGGTGFLGANLARVLLEKGLRVRCLARKGGNRKNLEGLPVELVEGDLHDKAALRVGCAGARYVFHVAADYRIWVPDPAAMYAVNIQGAVNVLEAAGAAGAERIVHCSSVAAVRPPRGPGDPPSGEDCRYAGIEDIVGPYKKSKWLSENAALELSGKGLPIVVVNPAAPIGPYDIKPTPTGRIVADFLNRRMPSYIDTGLNIVHARDAAEGHWLAALKGRVGERYILGGENLTFKRALDLLEEATGLGAPRFKTPYALAYAFAAADTARARLFGGEPLAPLDAVRMARHPMFYDSAKAVRELGYSPRPARQALADAARWFIANGYAPAPPSLVRTEAGAA